jgi:hypothetical protein
MDPEMLDMMAMEEMMGGGMDPMMGGGMEEPVPVMVPGWMVPAVEELIAILGEGEMGGDPMAGAPMDPGMGGMPMDGMAF